MSCSAFDGPVRGLGQFAGKPSTPATSEPLPGASPRQVGIQREIELEIARQGHARHPPPIDTAALAKAIDEHLHG